jgi:hypothetical protein
MIKAAEPAQPVVLSFREIAAAPHRRCRSKLTLRHDPFSIGAIEMRRLLVIREGGSIRK